MPGRMAALQFVVGIDVGTTSVRAGVFSTATGARRGLAVQPIETWRPSPSIVQQSSADIWTAAGAACRAAVAAAVASGVDHTQIVGLGFDATCSLVVLDKAGLPLSVSPDGAPEQNVVVWCDHRALAEADEITAGGHSALKYVGGVMSPEMQPPKLLWLKRHLPASFDEAGKFFDLSDFLIYAATGLDVRSLCSNVCSR